MNAKQLAWIVALGACTSVARAEPRQSQPRGELVRMSRLPEAELMVDVTLSTNDADATFEIRSERSGAPLLVCGAPCQFRIWPGRYRLVTNATDHYVGGTSEFLVERDSRVQVVAPPSYRPALGALFGAVGLAAAVVGGFLLASNDCQSHCTSSTTFRSQAGFASLGAGLVLAPVGWIVFAQNRSPDLIVTPFEREGLESSIQAR